MLRTLTTAAAVATLAAVSFSPAAIAEDNTVNFQLKLETANIVDTATAEKALKTIERQARKACKYEVTSLKRKRTDWSCVDRILEASVEQLNVPLLTDSYNDSDMVVQIAARANNQETF